MDKYLPVYQSFSSRKLVEYIDYIIYLCLLIYLIIDSITGFLLETYDFSISNSFKIILSFIMLISIVSKRHSAFCYIIGYITLFFFYYIIHINSMFSWSSAFIMKLISIQIFFVYFYLLAESHTTQKNTAVFHTILIINSIVFLLNIGMGLLGFGYKTYGFYGIRGYFYAGNEVSVLFFCLYYYFLIKVTFKKQYMIFFYILALAISILIGTKTGVLAAFLISIIDYYYRLKKRFFFRLFFPIIITLLIISIIHFLTMTELYSFIESNIKRLMSNGGSLLNALLSGRAERVVLGYNTWESTLSVSTFFMGYPSPWTYEIDFFDALFHGGMIFLLLTLFFYMYLIYLSYKKKNKKLLFFNIIYLAISFTAGHVWYSVMAGLFFTYINVYELKIKYQDKPNCL